MINANRTLKDPRDNKENGDAGAIEYMRATNRLQKINKTKCTRVDTSDNGNEYVQRLSCEKGMSRSLCRLREVIIKSE